MISPWKPSAKRIERLLQAANGQQPTYACVGSSANWDGSWRQQGNWHEVQETTVLGRGATCFDQARQALRDWRMFALPWTTLFPRPTPLGIGSDYAILAKAYGSWSICTARILYHIDETDRFGFGIGTLPAHEMRGEERFLVSRDPIDDRVTYELASFSQPRSLAARLGLPLIRAQQRRFADESAGALRQTCAAFTKPAALTVSPVAVGTARSPGP